MPPELHEPVELRIIDISGRERAGFIIEPGGNELSMKHLLHSGGIYFVEIRASQGGAPFREKIIFAE